METLPIQAKFDVISGFLDRHRQHLGYTAADLDELVQALDDCEAWLPEETRSHVREGARVILAHVRDSLATFRAGVNRVGDVSPPKPRRDHKLPVEVGRPCA